MNKVIHSQKNITPHGGLNFIYPAMNQMELDKFMDEQIGWRNVFAKYSYSNVVYLLFGNALMQSNLVADLQTLKKKYSKQVLLKSHHPIRWNMFVRK
jgi:hypothetical protein